MDAQRVLKATILSKDQGRNMPHGQSSCQILSQESRGGIEPFDAGLHFRTVLLFVKPLLIRGCGGTKDREVGGGLRPILGDFHTCEGQQRNSGVFELPHEHGELLEDDALKTSATGFLHGYYTFSYSKKLWRAEARRNSGKLGCDQINLISLDEVTRFDVIEVLNTDTALIALGDFLGVVLESLE